MCKIPLKCTQYLQYIFNLYLYIISVSGTDLFRRNLLYRPEALGYEVLSVYDRWDDAV